MMSGRLQNGKKIIILIEWKYTELYNKTCLAHGEKGEKRKRRYNDLIAHKNLPLKKLPDLDDYYYEPFYQLMRQTLLAWQMVKYGKDELH